MTGREKGGRKSGKIKKFHMHVHTQETLLILRIIDTLNMGGIIVLPYAAI